MTHKTSLLALAAALPLLAACGEPGASEEMREADGEANAPGTYIPESEVETPYTGFAEQGTPDEGDRSGIELPPGGDEDGPGATPDRLVEEEYDPVADPQEEPADPTAGDQTSRTMTTQDEDGTVMARSPDIISQETRDQLTAQAALRERVGDARRGDEAMARDRFRRPAETLSFFGVEPDMTVVEVYPGGGYYTDILAPYLAEEGRYYVTAGERPGSADRTREQFSDAERYGRVRVVTLGPERGLSGVPAGSADMVLTFRNVHNFTMGGYGEQAFQGFYDALKPGGVLGVVEHRLPEGADDAMMDSSGYMKQSRVVELAEAAGFELAEASELNANPDDTADHPFGVWTLPPVSRTEDRDGNAPDGFDADRYRAIGESDRMTLRFVKPLGADGALME